MEIIALLMIYLTLPLYTLLAITTFSQDYDLASYITYIVCVDFIREQRESQFKFGSEWQIFKKP